MRQRDRPRYTTNVVWSGGLTRCLWALHALRSKTDFDTIWCASRTRDSTRARFATEWAPIDLLVSRADLWRPAPLPFHIHAVLYLIAAMYILMLLAVFALALPSPRKPLQLIAVVGLAGSAGLLRTGQRSFGWLFYGGFTHSRIWDGDSLVKGLLLGWQGLQFDAAYFVLLGVMPLLAVAVMRVDDAVSAEDDAVSAAEDERLLGRSSSNGDLT